MIEAFDSLARQHAKEMDEAHDTIAEYQTLCREMLAALAIAEDFMSGFEDDEMQEGMAEKMAQIRAAIAKAGG